MDYHWSGNLKKKKSFLRWDCSAKYRSKREQEVFAAHQSTASLLLCCQEHQQACKNWDRAHMMLVEGVWVCGCTIALYVSVSICMCQWVMFKTVWVCVLYPLPRETGFLSKLDSVIGSSENPNEAMSIWAAAPLPWAPRSPQAGPSPTSALPQTRWKAKRDGIWGRKKGEWTTNCFNCYEGDCSKTVINIIWL